VESLAPNVHPVDTLHFDCSNSSLTDRSHSSSLLPMVHLCDAPSTANHDRRAGVTPRARTMPPGDGGIDIAAILRRMPRDAQITLEVPMQSLTERKARGRGVTSTTLRCDFPPGRSDRMLTGV
jgi:sugar phosphate isomerase/epimerase